MAVITANIDPRIMSLLGGIDIRFSVTDLKRWTRAIDKIYRRAVFYVGGELQRLQAVDLAAEIYVAINVGQHANFKGYSKNYKKWKQEHYPSQGFWKLGGDLLNNLHAFPASRTMQGGQDWAAGVPNGVMDTGGKSFGLPGHAREIAWYGHKMEYGSKAGGQTHPKRSIFAPRTRDYAKSWRRRDRAVEALRYVSQGWR